MFPSVSAQTTIDKMKFLKTQLGQKLTRQIRGLVRGSDHRKVLLGVGLAALVLTFLQKLRKPKGVQERGQQKKSGGNVDMTFLSNIWKLIKIVVPSLASVEFLSFIVLTVLLIYRTVLSISISTVNGKIVRSIVSRDWHQFLRNIFNLALFAVPASLINSGLDYLIKRMAISFRENLTNALVKEYLKGNVFYQMTNLDTRIPYPDQRLTQDINKWATSLSNIYPNIAKPILDIVLFSRKLTELVGSEGPIAIILWYFAAGVTLRLISPSFGRLTAIEQQNEGKYRAVHSRIVTNCEEIAFYRGGEWERLQVDSTLNSVLEHTTSILYKKFFIGGIDSILVRYGAVSVAYIVMGLPVFGRNRAEYLKRIGTDPGAITRDYIRNSSLLTNLSKAIGRLIISYKEIQHLAGYTLLISELSDTLKTLQKGEFKREMIEGSFSKNSRGRVVEGGNIKFQNVPIAAPNGDIFIRSLDFEMFPGQNVFIYGPNGCGKSSMFRILADLWPVFEGMLLKPERKRLYFMPQKDYLPYGTFRDQMIYPDNLVEMRAKGVSDEDLTQLLQLVNLEEVLNRRGGFDNCEEWIDTLSGGQKQRLGICRLLYHKPEIAVLDDCTSAVSQEIEGTIYQECRKAGITLITVSHRETLMKYHDILLKLDGEGNYEVRPISN